MLHSRFRNKIDAKSDEQRQKYTKAHGQVTKFYMYAQEYTESKVLIKKQVRE